MTATPDRPPTPAARPPSAPAVKPVVRFPDTSALVTLAIHPPLQQIVTSALSNTRRVLLQAVVTELQGLEQVGGDLGGWAAAALGQLDWLGAPVLVDDPVGTEVALAFQNEVAAGRPLRHPAEHYGEAAIVALASRAQHLRPRLLSDDYDARILAHNHHVEPLSVHKMLTAMIAAKRITAQAAAECAEALHVAGRASDYTAHELQTGKLGRVGKP